MSDRRELAARGRGCFRSLIWMLVVGGILLAWPWFFDIGEVFDSPAIPLGSLLLGFVLVCSVIGGVITSKEQLSASLRTTKVARLVCGWVLVAFGL